MEFSYRAITAEGQRVSGRHTARDQSAARRELMSRFSSVLELSPLSAREASDGRPPFRVRADASANFFRRLSTMLGSGVPLADALDFMATSEADSTLAEAFSYLTQKVLLGNSLSGSMADPRLGRLFDSVSCGMVAMAEQTGQLGRVTSKLADLKERQLSLSRSLLSALTYPAVLLLAIVALAVLFTLVLGPGDSGLFAAFGTSLPWPTRVVQGIASLARQPLLLLGGGLLLSGVILGVRYKLRHDKDLRLRVHRVLLRIPVLGSVIMKIESAKIMYVLADALEVGLPAVQALSMARDVAGNDEVRRQLQEVLKNFSDGLELSQSLQRQALFPPMVLSMIEVGMESGKLDLVLARASASFEEEVQMALENLTRLAEPLLLCFAGLMAGFLAIATLLPIIRMVESL